MTCCICRNQITSSEPYIFFVGEAGDKKEACEKCEKNYTTVLESDNSDEIKEAINYLYTCSLSVTDKEVVSFLNDTIESNSSIVDEIKQSEPINTNNKADYFSSKQTENQGGESFWISCMRLFAWISFVAIIIGGIVFAVQVGEDDLKIGFLMFLASAITAFISVASIMVFLDMASDVSEIKKILRNKDK